MILLNGLSLEITIVCLNLYSCNGRRFDAVEERKSTKRKGCVVELYLVQAGSKMAIRFLAA